MSRARKASIIAGFVYVWAKGDLDWVKSAAAQQRRTGGRR